MAFLFGISLVWLVGVHACGLWLGRRLAFLINPLSLLTAYSLIKTAPYSVLSYTDPEIVDIRALPQSGTEVLHSVIIQFNLLYGLFFGSLVCALVIVNGYSIQRKLVDAMKKWAQSQCPSAIDCATLCALAVVFVVLKWNVIGGIEATLLGEDFDRAVAGTGIGYLLAPADLTLSFACMFTMMRYQVTRRSQDLWAFVLMSVLAAFSFSLFGGRKALLQHVIISLALWNLAGGKFRVFSFGFLGILFASLLYFLSILYVRIGEIEFTANSPERGSFLLSVLTTFLANFSYNNTYYFLIDHFSKANLFLGATFVDLLTAALPSSLFPDKPPVDEGVYVKALLSGMNLEIPTPARELAALGSIPPETFGIFIMNFGALSVAFAGVLLALLFRFGALAALGVGPRFLVTYVVFHSALNFQVTNLRIVNLLTVLAFGAAILLLVRVLPLRVFSRRMQGVDPT
jgi:hypothetical protein